MEIDNQVYITEQPSEIDAINQRIDKSNQQREDVVKKIKELKSLIQIRKNEIKKIRSETLAEENDMRSKISSEKEIFKDEQKRLIQFYQKSVSEFQKVINHHNKLQEEHQKKKFDHQEEIVRKNIHLDKEKTRGQINRRRQLKYNQNDIKFERQSRKQIQTYQNEIKELEKTINNQELEIKKEENILTKNRLEKEINIRNLMIANQKRIDDLTTIIQEKKDIIQKLKNKFIDTKAPYITSLITDHTRDLDEFQETKNIAEESLNNTYNEYQIWKDEHINGFFIDLRENLEKNKRRKQYCLDQISGLKRKIEKRNQKYQFLIIENQKNMDPLRQEIKNHYQAIEKENHFNKIENLQLEDEREKHLDYLYIIDQDIDRAHQRLEIASKRIEDQIKIVTKQGLEKEKEIENEIVDIYDEIKEQRDFELVIDEKIYELNERIAELKILDHSNS